MAWSLPVQGAVPVVFAKTTRAGFEALAEGRGVVLYPASDRGWNDFSHRVHINAMVRTEAGVSYGYALRMLVEGATNTVAALTQRLGDNRSWMPLDAGDLRFVSMLQNAQSYEQMVQQLGFELAVRVLRATGDAVVLQLEGGAPERQALLQTDGFHLAVLRESETYTAFRRAARHLRPQPAPPADDAAISLLIAARLRSAATAHVVDFDFTPDPLGRDRLAVLIGPNGAGKTQIILSMLDALRSSDHTPLLSAGLRAPHILRSTEGALAWGAPPYNRVLVFSSTHSDVYPQSLPPWELDYQYFSMTGGRERGGDALTVSLVDCLRDDRRLMFDPLPAGEDDPDDLDFGDPIDRLKLLQSLLEPLGLWRELHLPLTSSDDLDFGVRMWGERAYFPIWRRMNEQRNLQLFQHIDLSAEPLVFSEGEVRRLSSGETAMLRFASQAVAGIEVGTLLLFDEPETHLHPSFISGFAEVLHRLLKQTRSVAIIATHSVYLVRETPSQRVRILAVEDGAVTAAAPRMQTFGASLESISHAVFGDGLQRHRFQRTLAEWVAEDDQASDIETVLENHGADLNPETLSYIARLLAGSRPERLDD